MDNTAKFSIGKVVMSNSFTQLFSSDEEALSCALTLIQRHARGDYGDVCDEEKRQNERGLLVGHPSRIMSSYALPCLGETVWVITESDRSATTVVLPSDY